MNLDQEGLTMGENNMICKCGHDWNFHNVLTGGQCHEMNCKCDRYNPSLQPAKDNCSMDIESNNDKEPLIKNNQPLVNISQEVRRDYTQIEYSKEWFDKNQAHTIQDILYFKKNSCDNIIHIGEHFLLDLYPIYCNGTNRSATDVEIWEVENIEGKYYDKIRRDCFNYKPIRKITTGKQFNYPNGYWKIRDVESRTLESGDKK